MWRFRDVFLLIMLCLLAVSVAAQGTRRGGRQWQTLSGNAPLVIARGGFSGVFPYSSGYAYELALLTGLPNLHIWCDVQLTKDGAGICFPDIRLQNASDIKYVYGNKSNTYTIDGKQEQGWFSVDFTLKDLKLVNMNQGIHNRVPHFDGNNLPILTVDDVVRLTKPPGLWLNIPHDAFFSQHNLSMRSFIISASRRMIVNYISSPEVGFLRSIVSRFRTGPTKLVFQFLGPDDVEPLTNQTYRLLMKNLTFIKTFATGIIVPKSYIWPVDNSLYLHNYTSLVLDSHEAGLEVFASDFANDASLPYNYSYDPVVEYLSFIDNGQFSVDGVLSDFPITASATIDCFSHMGKNDTVQAKLLIISSEGASGDYPGCTDEAYAKAVSDGVDILDCPVQMTNDGIPFCLGSIDLKEKTNTGESIFTNLSTTNSDLNIIDGILAYNLTWSQIQTLKPAISNPYSIYSMFRNPAAKHVGNLMQLSDFLAFAHNASSISGVLISIELQLTIQIKTWTVKTDVHDLNAAYLAEKQGLGVADAVLDALSKAGYNNQTAKRIMITSSDSAVLSKFKSTSNYELVYLIDEIISDILNTTILEIRKFASSVVIRKASIFPSDDAFITGKTSIIPKIKAFDLPVYVKLFRNEFRSQPYDFFSDAYVEINAHYFAGIDGVITDYPATAARFKRNRCLGYKDTPPYMMPLQARLLIDLISPTYLPPAEAPSPILTDNDVAEPPLPPVTGRPSTVNTGSGSTAPGPTPRNGQPALFASTILHVLAILLSTLICGGQNINTLYTIL
ncbi:glycerophosphodiester phosphodiesterase GDPDL3-like isoform X1 [Sesamum indicum]|uniref:glycerophosphodiester phosphodiesterase n=1 Tax=Sesamum indicum TaxID=4182 RepID=A0A8M8V420_SESIN|nr:glycerophosphodiester phosphodiesterase GDPDL3-like isoform X1 [Sesamum indicum]XP_020553823.1 glycerophosphodiester phosphodiesterase GDPDL3-like isoform X1 [Sesamum indicum]